MAKKESTYAKMENFVLKAFKKDSKVTFKGVDYTIITVGKPKTSGGEPKTDVFVKLEDEFKSSKYIKISYKMESAHFIENKISAQRAEDIFGNEWKKIVVEAVKSLEGDFENRQLFYPKKSGNTEAGSFTLGWRLDLINNDSGELNCKLQADDISEAYKGEKQPSEKKDAKVNGEIVANSGVPNYILVMNVDENTNIDDILNELKEIDSYCENKLLYTTFRALNYRSCANKIDGNRPLAVYIEWTIEDEKLKASLVYDNPLKKKGNEVRDSLKEELGELNLEQKLLDVLEDNISSEVFKQTNSNGLFPNTQS